MNQMELKPMKTINKYLAAGIALVIIASVLFLALSAVGPTFSATLSGLVARASTPTRRAVTSSRSNRLRGLARSTRRSRLR
jgi:hypothetical protein